LSLVDVECMIEYQTFIERKLSNCNLPEFKGKLLEFVKIEQIKASRVSHKENSISPLFNQVEELS
jgi:hypothetical protein